METKVELGKQVPLEDYFQAPEGELNMYYGTIGSGKTYGATADILEELNQGRLVYATWPIKLDAFDDRQSIFMVIRNLIFWRKPFFRVNCPENFHYINAEKGEVDGIRVFNPEKTAYRDEYIEYLNTLNHCSLYIDEAWRVIDSYSRTSNFTMENRNLILVTRHKFRKICLIAQRPTSVQVTARANVNRFFKFVKIATWPWVRFARYEFQEMTGETVNEDVEPISVKTYWLNTNIANRYNSYYYGELEPLHKVQYDVWKLDLKEKIIALYRILFRKNKGKNQITTQTPF